MKPQIQTSLVAALLCAVVTSELRAQVPPIITYQGRVQVNGNDPPGDGQFKFALVDPGVNTARPATARATVTSGFVTAITVTDGGSGYTAAPLVTIAGPPGSGATATANVSAGAVTSITVNSAGSGYPAVITVTIAPPPPALVHQTYWSNDGTSVGGSQPSAAVTLPVRDGLFTVGLGDARLPNMAALGTDVLTHPGVHLRIWFNDGVQGFARLSPDQPLTSSPYALLAGRVAAGGVTTDALADGSVTSAKLANGAVGNAQLGTISTAGKVANSATTATSANTPNAIVARDASGNFSAGAITASAITGNGAGLTGLNASQLGLGTVPSAALGNAWKLGGNAGTTAGTHFLGTTDNQPVELRINSVRVLRLEPTGDSVWDGGTEPDGAPNVIGGAPVNSVAPGVVGATISGGGATNSGSSAKPNSVSADYGTIGGGQGNTIQPTAWHATIGGGYRHTIQTNATYTTISGGTENTIQANSHYATIGGGIQNTIQSTISYATISGGFQNTIQTNSHQATISGGQDNKIVVNSQYATIPGGQSNSATNYAFAAGRRAKANHTGAFVWADSTDVDFASTAANQLLIRASGGVGIGTTSPDSPLTVAGTVHSTSGGFQFPDGSVQTNAVGGSAVVPIGAVIDWWRPNNTFPIPAGYKICDGSAVNDAQSPFNGQTVPNLQDRFVRGAASINNIGEIGGAATHTHTISGATGSRVVTMGASDGPNLLASFGFSFEAATSSHTHTTASHDHSAGSLANSVSVHLPPYVGLLKIMRIR